MPDTRWPSADAKPPSTETGTAAKTAGSKVQNVIPYTVLVIILILVLLTGMVYLLTLNSTVAALGAALIVAVSLVLVVLRRPVGRRIRLSKIWLILSTVKPSPHRRTPFVLLLLYVLLLTAGATASYIQGYRWNTYTSLVLSVSLAVFFGFAYAVGWLANTLVLWRRSLRARFGDDA